MTSAPTQRSPSPTGRAPGAGRVVSPHPPLRGVVRGPGVRRPRRRPQIALGLAWLLDAALQYQPYMFTRAFATQVISASAAGSPHFVASPVALARRPDAP